MKTATILVFSGIICMLIAGNIRRERQTRQKLNIPLSLSDTTFIHEKDGSYYVITVSPLDVNNVPKEEE